MGYNKLSECTLTADERRAEATRICKIVWDVRDQMSDKELEFVERVWQTGMSISVAQLFWLRDIKDKYQ